MMIQNVVIETFMLLESHCEGNPVKEMSNRVFGNPILASAYSFIQ